MQKSLKNFFLFSLLLAFIFNVSGMSVRFEHSKHDQSISGKSKDSKTEKGATFSQDHDCQCALHLQMNHLLLPESAGLELSIDTLVNNHISHSNETTYRCLLDYFSSRAPPAPFLAVG